MNEFVKNLERIEFVVTMACTGKCKHCSQGNHDSVSEHFRADVAEKVISDICGKYKIQSLMTFGGEPLLYPEVVSRIHKAATEQKIPKRQLITNGFFSKDRKRIKEVVDMLADSGLGQIALSVDAFHQETIPLEPVKYLGEYFDENKEYTNPYDEDPKDIRAIGFLPNGDVLNDNVYQNNIIDILNGYRPFNCYGV